MKRITYLFFTTLLLTVILSACDTMRQASGPVGPPQAAFVGTWTITNVAYTNLADGAVTTAFDQAPPHDFTNSTWELTNSGSGKYTLATGVAQNIAWSVNGGDALGAIFNFKKLDKGQTPDNVTKSYQLVISKHDETSMTLKTLVYLGSKNGYVVYTFSKIK